MRYLSILAIALGVLFSQACKSQKINSDRSTFSDRQELIILDSTSASVAVITDEKEGFFERVRIIDMSIQMRRNYPEDTPWETVVKDYKAFLQADVANFSMAEREQLRKVFRQAHQLCEAIHPDIFPAKLQLIKSKGQPYGPMTFYTRENCIVIPQGLLGPGNEESLLDIALHETFHIFSRYHPEKRKALYGLIGFKAIPLEQLIPPNALNMRILLNPDGINYAYRIELKGKEEEKLLAIPLIVANATQFSPEKESFFSYLSFQLYEIEPPYGKLIRVRADEQGNSTLKLREHPEFFQQITDNTQYIIHPDEIMADNFMFLATGKVEEGRSEPGKKLLKEVERILKQP